MLIQDNLNRLHEYITVTLTDLQSCPLKRKEVNIIARMKTYSGREARRIVKANGWKLSRTKGDHWIYKNDKNDRLLVIPTRLNRMLWRRLVKEYDIDLEV